MYLFQNGDRFQGELGQDKKSGDGEFLFASGANFKGSFKNCLLHGRGELTMSGTRFVGEWDAGRPVLSVEWVVSNEEYEYRGFVDEKLRKSIANCDLQISLEKSSARNSSATTKESGKRTNSTEVDAW